MKIKFLGIREESKKGGCPVCGRSVNKSISLRYSQHITFPNGKNQVFILNHIYDVNDEEGTFLLKISYPYKGEERHPFALV